MLYLPGSNQCEVTGQTSKFVNQICIWFSKTLLNRSPRKLTIIEHQHRSFIWMCRILHLRTGKQAVSPHSKWVNASDSTCICMSYTYNSWSISYDLKVACYGYESGLWVLSYTGNNDPWFIGYELWVMIYKLRSISYKLRLCSQGTFFNLPPHFDMTHIIFESP